MQHTYVQATAPSEAVCRRVARAVARACAVACARACAHACVHACALTVIVVVDAELDDCRSGLLVQDDHARHIRERQPEHAHVAQAARACQLCGRPSRVQASNRHGVMRGMHAMHARTRRPSTRWPENVHAVPGGCSEGGGGACMPGACRPLCCARHATPYGCRMAVPAGAQGLPNTRCLCTSHAQQDMRRTELPRSAERHACWPSCTTAAAPMHTVASLSPLLAPGITAQVPELLTLARAHSCREGCGGCGFEPRRPSGGRAAHTALSRQLLATGT